MKQPRRWVVLVAALMMAASLVATPREGMGGAPGRPIDDAGPPQENFGEPDTPGGSPQMIARAPEWWATLLRLQWLTITKGRFELRSPTVLRPRAATAKRATRDE